MYYLNSRYYDANTGRFVSADGQLNLGSNLSGINLFSYCGNQPVNRIDTNGHSWWDIAIVCAAVAVVCVIAVVAAPVLAAAAGVEIVSSALIAAAYVGYVAATVGAIACGIAATETIAAHSTHYSTPQIKSHAREKSIARTSTSSRQQSQSRYYYAEATHPGAKIYKDQPLNIQIAKSRLSLGYDVYAESKFAAEELCIVTGGGFTGPTNDNNPLNAMHYHTLDILIEDMCFGSDPNLKFVTIFD